MSDQSQNQRSQQQSQTQNQQSQSNQTPPDITADTLERIAKYRKRRDELEARLFDSKLSLQEIVDVSSAIQSLSTALKALQESEDAIKRSYVESSKLDNELKKVIKEGEYTGTIVSLEMMKRINDLRK